MYSASIIIPTFNRYPVIIDTINYLLPQAKETKAEIILVDQSEKQFSTLIEAYAKKHPIVTYIHVTPPSLPNARNIGIRNSRSNYIIFFDDDIIPEENLIHHHIQGFAHHPNIGCVAGRVRENNSDITNTSKPGVHITFYGKILRNLDYASPAFIHAPLGANMSFRKDVLEKVGLFDVYYKGNATLEETDYGIRVRKAGYKIYFNPHANLFHLLTPSGGCRIINTQEKEFHNIHNTTRFFFKNQNKLYTPFFLLILFLSAVKRLRHEMTYLSICFFWLKAVRKGFLSSLKEKT